MKLYEFRFSEKKITTVEYEVTETAKQYATSSGYIDYNCLRRISKNLIGIVLEDELRGLYYLATENKVEVARKAFIEYLENKKIPSCEEKVQKANAALMNVKTELESLIEQTAEI